MMFAPTLLSNAVERTTASLTLRHSPILHSTVQARGQLSLSLKYCLQFLSLEFPRLKLADKALAL